MNAKRVFFGMIGLTGIFVIGIFLALMQSNKILSNRSSKLLELKLNSRVLDEQQTLLFQAIKDIDKYKKLEEVSRAIVPQDKDQAKAVRQIVNIASESQIKLGAISFPVSTLGQAAVPSSTPGSATSKSTSSSVSQVKAVENIPGVYVMEIIIQQDTNNPVSYDRMISFLSRLEQNRRTAHVVNVTVQPDTQNRALLTFNLVVNIYIKP